MRIGKGGLPSRDAVDTAAVEKGTTAAVGRSKEKISGGQKGARFLHFFSPRICRIEKRRQSRMSQDKKSTQNRANERRQRSPKGKARALKTFAVDGAPT